MWLAGLCFLMLAACARDTGVFAEVRGPKGVSAFTLSVAGPHGLLASQSFKGAPPGSVFVRLAAASTDVRLVARSAEPALVASGVAHITAGDQTSVTMTLAADALDSDADGWPDAVDHCPLAADATQEDTDGDGVGDACSAPSLDAGTRVPCSQRAGLLGCVDFEDGGFELGNFGDAVATVEVGNAAGGKRSLRVDRPSGSDTYSGQYMNIAHSNTPIFVRFFLKLDPGHPPRPGIVEAQQTINNDGVVMIFETDATTLKDVSLFNRKTMQTIKITSGLNLGGWNCYELEIRPGPTATATVNLWVDEALLPGSGSGGAFNVDRVVVGATYDVNEGGPVLLDEVAWSDTRIHCQ